MAFPYGPPHQQGISYILSYHGISLWSSTSTGHFLYPILSWHFPMVLHINRAFPISYPIMAFPYGPPHQQGISYILSYHGISLFSSTSTGHFLYPILSWHFPIFL